MRSDTVRVRRFSEAFLREAGTWQLISYPTTMMFTLLTTMQASKHHNTKSLDPRLQKDIRIMRRDAMRCDIYCYINDNKATPLASLR